ncbi:hypothetical protein U1Q18_001090 [Sarracenia purpurea var. burkii]
MESQQSEPNSIIEKTGDLSKESRVQMDDSVLRKQEESIGILHVYIHQAREIHNICIYHKQDVYAKIYLTSDPDRTVSTQIVNGGGKNPIFNETLQLNVRSIASSLKCEVWMLSRVKNYLEDQLLGFALVPLSEIATWNGKFSQEFSLSSSDLVHSPAGFIQLTLSYAGASPEILEISTPRSSAAPNLSDSELPVSARSELDKIEFPDPNLVNENEMMVSEYFGMPCPNLESTNPKSLSTTENGNVDVGEGSVSTTASPPLSIPASSQLPSDGPGASKPLNQNGASSLKEKIKPEKEVVQQEIVDMYMKSMKEFTESLAKMKLPLDMDNGTSADLGSDNKVEAPKDNGRSPRVFYGSRAFF